MIDNIARHARRASNITAALSADVKNEALRRVGAALEACADEIMEANVRDLDQAERDRLGPVLLKRLRFDRAGLTVAVQGIHALVDLPDPVGRTRRATRLAEGLELYQVTCPLGVLGIVFESRPDALVQISTLALKSGNAVLLKGGAEAAYTNRVLARVIDQAAQDAGLPAGWLALLETRADVKAMLALDDYIDLVIPRGSNAFVRYIMDNTRIPVMGHADGICHVYVDGDADMQQAVEIAVDSKCQYPAVCNAMETLLVDEGVAAEFLPRAKRAFDEGGVELRGCDRTRVVIDCYQAGEKDWRTEYNDLILSVRVVDGLDAAIDHINTYGSGHTDAIVTRNAEHARRFLARVDSADVFWNCSTRFSDGYRFGLGAEVGISTSKLHARGPVGLEGLVIYKWLLLGQGHTVRQFVGADARVFDHVPLDKDFSL